MGRGRLPRFLCRPVISPATTPQSPHRPKGPWGETPQWARREGSAPYYFTVTAKRLITGK